MHIIFMGTPEFAVPALQALIDSEHEVIAVYCQPPRPAGRGQKLRPSPVQKLADARDIPLYYPDSLKSESEQRIFRDLQADIAVVAAYGLLLPKAILEGTKLGCINVHPSLLPRWRGAAPIQRPIMAGDTETGVCIMQMEAGLDTGPIYMFERLPLPQEATAGVMHDTLAERGAKLTLNVLQEIDTGTAKATPQSEEGVTYAYKISKEEARINWNQPATTVHNHIRGLSPYPGAFFEWEAVKYKILAASCLPLTPPASRAEITHQSGSIEPSSPRLRGEVGRGASPGTILSDKLHIACKEGVIVPLRIQKQGKKAMELTEFLKGNTIPKGAGLS